MKQVENAAIKVGLHFRLTVGGGFSLFDDGGRTIFFDEDRNGIEGALAYCADNADMWKAQWEEQIESGIGGGMKFLGML
jgi:hypothetical protein